MKSENVFTEISQEVNSSAYMYDFIERFAPHLTKSVVEKAMMQKNNDEVERMFKGLTLPVK